MNAELNLFVFFRAVLEDPSRNGQEIST